MFKFKFPKDSPQYSWTNHIKNKMLFHGLSEQRILRVLKTPKRVEEGVAEGTTAAMQSSTTRKNPEEIWVMYRTKPMTNDKRLMTRGKRLTMISTWRYPGISKPGNMIPIPDDIREELGI